MERFFNPGSIAVFGVSPRISNLGRIIIENLDRFGFAGKVYPFGPRPGRLGERRICTVVDEIEETPDLAVLLIPARQIPGSLDSCGRKGISNVIVQSGGFSELSGTKRILEKEIVAIASRYNIKMIGPNCFGVISMEHGLVLPFFNLNPEYMKAGGVSFISQSGGLVYDTCMLASCENLGLNKLVSVGNKLLIDENDVLEYMMADSGSGVIGLYLEHFSDGRRLANLALRTEKPIVLLKGNRSPEGSEIARFHTAALAGDDLVAEAALRRAGIHRVQNFHQMIEYFKIFSLPPLKGPGLAVISRSGGHGVLAADAVHRHGCELARLSTRFFRHVEGHKKKVIRATNPLDVGDAYNLEAYSDILDMALKERNADGIVFVVTYSSESDGARIEDFIRHASAAASRHGKPVALCMVSNRDQWFSMKGAADFPVFADVDHAIEALAASFRHYRNHAGRGKTERPRLSRPGKRSTEPGVSSRILPVEETYALLKARGLPVVDYAVVGDAAEGLHAAQAIGYSVALKVASPVLLHKTEAKGVQLGIPNARSLRRAFHDMTADAWLVQKMYPPGREVIIGGRRDREFGPVLLFGLGGVLVEVMRDAAISLCPVDEEEAEVMLREIRGSSILKGVRGEPPSHREALKKVLVLVSLLMAEHEEIVNLDLNPVIVLEEGRGCAIVDARIEVSATTPPR
jgi:acyl-CoA synthetase (NDP forming)